MRKIILGGSLFLAGIATGSAQNKMGIKFGKITLADFQVSSPVVDSNSNAVILSDIGSSEFIGNTNGDFTLIYKEHKRILLRNRKSFDAATVHLPVYIGSNYSQEEKFEDFEAATYTIENGQVVTAKLDKSAVFTEKINRERTERKFTFSNIKEGCIVEYQYTIKSPFYSHLRSWYFQDEYPCLWSEYRVTIPSMFNYVATNQGYLKYTIDSAGKIFKTYTITDPGDASSNVTRFSISGDAKFNLWALKNVPAFKPESFISSSRNYISKIQFTLHSIRYSDEVVHQAIKGWFETAEALLKDPDFGQQLTDNNSWISDLGKTVFKEKDPTEKAKKIFAYVRDNITCNDHDSYFLSQPLKKTFQSKSGNVADINLLLTAMLVNQGFDAHPVILSTRDNGYANTTIALLSQYNYVIARVKIDDVYYLLDASYNRLGFGKLQEGCYNYTGRVIDEKPVLVDLSPDSLHEEKRTSLFISNNDKGVLEGSFSSQLGDQGSFFIREKMVKQKKEDLLKELKKGIVGEIAIDNFTIDSLKSYDDPVSISYDLQFKFNGEDVIYFDPMLGEAVKKNPFASTERIYPVEMSAASSETYVMEMEIPRGYVIDEIPQSVRFKLNENQGMFEYLFSKTPQKIQMRSTIRLNKATFQQDDYDALREFYAFIIKKHSEQIVFKKIK